MDDAHATDVPLPTEDPPRCFSHTHSYSDVHNHQPNSNDLGSHKSNDDFDNCESSHGRGNLESSDDLDHHESNDDLGNVESNYDLGKLESKDDLQNDKSNDLAGYHESSTGNEEFGNNDFNEFLRYQWEGHFRHNRRNNYPHSHLTNSSLPSKSAIEVRNEQNSLNYTHELPSNQITALISVCLATLFTFALVLFCRRFVLRYQPPVQENVEMNVVMQNGIGHAAQGFAPAAGNEEDAGPDDANNESDEN